MLDQFSFYPTIMYIMIVHMRVFNETTAGIERQSERGTDTPALTLTYETYFTPGERLSAETGYQTPEAL